jgi:hypothetical protein
VSDTGPWKESARPEVACNPIARPAAMTDMRIRLMLFLALAAPFVLAGCGKGKY